MLEWDLGVGDVSFIKDESAQLDYVQKIQDNCHLGAASALKGCVVIECFSPSLQLSSSNSILIPHVAIPFTRMSHRAGSTD